MSKNGQRLFRNFDPYITSPFGYRINPISKERSLHAGVDYGTNGKNIPCYGLADGEVSRTGFQKALGNYVYVNYPSLGHGALYQHLDSIKVKKGEKVTKDTVIGITGATGEVTGIHLHFAWFPSSDINKDWYSIKFEDYEKYVFPTILGIIGTPVSRDSKKDQIEVIISNLRVRSTPNGKILGYIKKGIYNILDSKFEAGYTWYKIGNDMWIAYTKEYGKLYLKVEEVKIEEPKEDSEKDKEDAPQEEIKKDEPEAPKEEEEKKEVEVETPKEDIEEDPDLSEKEENIEENPENSNGFIEFFKKIFEFFKKIVNYLTNM